MIITLSGSNSFGLQREITSLTAGFERDHGSFAIQRLDGGDSSLADITEAVSAISLLAEQKLVVLREPGQHKSFAEDIEHILAAVSDTTTVIIVEPKLDKRSAYYKFLKKNTDFREHSSMDANGLARWLQEAAKAKQGSISSNDARYLVDRVGPNQQLLAHELEKLLIYNPSVSRSSIDLLTEASPQSTIFELLEAAFAGRGERAMHLYQEQRALKVEPQQIIAMLAWQLHVLAIIKTAGSKPVETIAKEAKLNPFVVRKSQATARRLSLPELKQYVSDLLKIDTASKRSALDIDDALQHYLLKLAATV